MSEMEELQVYTKERRVQLFIAVASANDFLLLWKDDK